MIGIESENIKYMPPGRCKSITEVLLQFKYPGQGE